MYNSSSSSLTIQDFVLRTLNIVGAAVEEVEWGIYDVLLPGEKVARIMFDAELAEEQNDCELVTYGSPFLELMVDEARKRGRLQVRKIESRMGGPSGNVEDKLSNLVHFIKCKPPKTLRAWSEEGLLLLCRFQVTFQGNEIAEHLLSVLMDVHSLADITTLLPALEGHWFMTGPAVEGGAAEDAHVNEAGSRALKLGTGQVFATGSSEPTRGSLPVRVPFSLETVFAQAVKTVQPMVRERMQAISKESKLDLHEELEQSLHYYEATLRTLERQYRQTTDAARKDRLKKKIEATKLDKEHRMEDISRAYDVTADLRLDQAILYLAPVACIETEVQRKTDLFPYVFRYYPWASTWAPTVCPVCHNATSCLLRGRSTWHCGCDEDIKS